MKLNKIVISSMLAISMLTVPLVAGAAGNNSNGIGWWVRFQNWGHMKKAPLTIPVISNLVATSNKAHKAVITWDTDVKGDSEVWISTSSPVVTAGRDPDWGSNSRVTKHKVNLNADFDPGTKYYVVVASENEAGVGTSTETWFIAGGGPVTPPTTNHAPVIMSLVGSTTISAGGTENVTLVTKDQDNSPLSYKVNWGDGSATTTAATGSMLIATSTFSHVYPNPGTFTAVFTVQDDTLLTVSSSLVINVIATSTPDTTPPTWSNVNNVNVQATSTAGRLVTFTNPTATDNIDGNRPVTCNPMSGTNFSVGTTTVTCNASDLSGNNATTTFSVVVSPRTSAPIISDTLPIVGTSTTTITWMTDEPTNSKVYYGTTTPLNLGTASFISNGSFVKSHSLSLSPVATSTQYYFVIQSAASDGRSATTIEMGFISGSGM